MKRIALAAALTLALAGNIALADDGGGDNSMSRWTGESYASFAATANDPRGVRLTPAESASVRPAGENSMSRWNGDSYAAFEQARTAPNQATIAIAEANRARAAANREVPPRTASRTRTPVNAFRDDTAG
jgi:hypothetical protein